MKFKKPMKTLKVRKIFYQVPRLEWRRILEKTKKNAKKAKETHEVHAPDAPCAWSIDQHDLYWLPCVTRLKPSLRRVRFHENTTFCYIFL